MTMTLNEAMEARHSVRSYLEKPLSKEAYEELTKEIEDINLSTGLHLQLVTNEPKAFSGALAR